MGTVLHHIAEEGRNHFTLGEVTVARGSEVLRVPVLVYFDFTHYFVQTVLRFLRRYGTCSTEVRVRPRTQVLDLVLTALAPGEEYRLELSFTSYEEYPDYELRLRRLRRCKQALLYVYSFTSDRTGYYRLTSVLTCETLGDVVVGVGPVEKIFEGDLTNLLVREVWPRESEWVRVHDVTRRVLGHL